MPESDTRHRESVVLLGSVFLVAICSLVYELLAGAVSSYLLGSSILQFSLVIGIFLTAMGIGSFASKYIRHNMIARFVQIELAIGILGGCSALLLFLAFSCSEIYRTVLIAVTGGIGILSGLEIPLILRILKEQDRSLRLSVANVMTADYLGALIASLAFPLVLVPHLGLMKSAFALGLLNVVVAMVCLRVFREQLKGFGRRLRWTGALALLVLVAGLLFSSRLVSFCEERVYPDEILFTRQTPYQRIVVTRWKDDLRLFLNGNLQFSSRDEYRYHESLVHPAMSAVAEPRQILILGGGDGMAARECLKYAGVEVIDLVDLDPAMTNLFRDSPLLSRYNSGALRDPRVRIHNTDAMQYIKGVGKAYDVVLIDLPDPSVLDLGKLYTRTFYAYVARSLKPAGRMAVQSSSPFFATNAFWCIVHTLESVTFAGGAERLSVQPYHVNVPSFGDWGFVLVGRSAVDPTALSLQVPTRFLNKAMLPGLFVFSRDTERRSTEINRLDNQILVRYYTRGYQEFYQ